MIYTIAEAAGRSGISAHTLRFYDKQGLLPFVDRSASGIRVFKESDFEWLRMINCLKHSGMSIKKIKEFIDWAMEGDSTIEIRLEFMREHKKELERQQKELQEHMELVDYKIWFYETSLEAGTTQIHKKEEKTILV